ncbi:Small-conductance mechanosensitive channel [Gammaproteobacteria bacterium]|nr:mechanosensitive ion channel family protein [Gammaproteobacteria bacterium]QOJ32491.1 MAG: mechanosensitive ion channel family protein [Gammaproteobacteria bacterium]CAG0939700.1 Small-conductance mechanosensitive channel [Gammaproteobacteria bacterium]
MDFENLLQSGATLALGIGLKILGALAAWIVGRWLIGLAIRLTSAALTRQQVDSTLQRYLGSIIAVTLNVVLVIAILGYFGLETTSFAALLAAAGIAIGAAWSGLLANFAAGVFLVILRPFKVGDFIAAGGVEGVVEAIGLFGTTINSGDNVHTIVGNNKIFSDNIRNFTVNPWRRVDRLAQLAHGVDPKDATMRLKAALAKIPNVMATPAPDVEIIDFTPMGPVLAVRPYCHNDHYWQVYFDTNRVIAETFGAAGYPVPEQHMRVKQGGS